MLAGLLVAAQVVLAGGASASAVSYDVSGTGSYSVGYQLASIGSIAVSVSVATGGVTISVLTPSGVEHSQASGTPGQPATIGVSDAVAGVWTLVVSTSSGDALTQGTFECWPDCFLVG